MKTKKIGGVILQCYGLIKRIIKQKTYSVGTVMLCEISPTLYAVLVYDSDGNIRASCCNSVFTGNKSVKKAVMHSLNKVFSDVQTKLMNKELVTN